MATIVDIRRRIKSVKSTQQMTKAMSFSAAEAFLCRRRRIACGVAASTTRQPERGRI